MIVQNWQRGKQNILKGKVKSAQSGRKATGIFRNDNSQPTGVLALTATASQTVALNSLNTFPAHLESKLP
jgi:hypothetical protein